MEVAGHGLARLLHLQRHGLLHRVPRGGVLGHHRAFVPRRRRRGAVTVRDKAKSGDIVRGEEVGKVLAHRIAVRLCPQRHLRLAQRPSKDDAILTTGGHNVGSERMQIVGTERDKSGEREWRCLLMVIDNAKMRKNA